uniref:Uncharacterized protein n=1 Tax=Avena sativa TaxID=4498 RepID=A0ACD5VKX4_AVESA
MQRARPPSRSRRGRPRAAPAPRCSHRRHRVLALAVIIVCLLLLGGGGSSSSNALLLAAAVPVRRLGAVPASVGYDVVGSRPVPEESSPPSSPLSPPAVGFADDKRPIPSCPDMLHNR